MMAQSPLSLHRSSYHRCALNSALCDCSILCLTTSGKYSLPLQRMTTSTVSFIPHRRRVRHMRDESVVSTQRFSTDAALWFPDMWHMALRIMDVGVPARSDKLNVEDEECTWSLKHTFTLCSLLSLKWDTYKLRSPDPRVLVGVTDVCHRR